MKITDPEIIKSGETDLIDSIKEKLDWSIVENLNKGNLQQANLECTDGDIVVHANQVAYQLNFEVKASFSVLLDRDGNIIESTTGDTIQQTAPQTKIDDSTDFENESAEIEDTTTYENPLDPPSIIDELGLNDSEELLEDDTFEALNNADDESMDLPEDLYIPDGAEITDAMEPPDNEELEEIDIPDSVSLSENGIVDDPFFLEEEQSIVGSDIPDDFDLVEDEEDLPEYSEMEDSELSTSDILKDIDLSDVDSDDSAIEYTEDGLPDDSDILGELALSSNEEESETDELIPDNADILDELNLTDSSNLEDAPHMDTDDFLENNSDILDDLDLSEPEDGDLSDLLSDDSDENPELTTADILAGIDLSDPDLETIEALDGLDEPTEDSLPDLQEIDLPSDNALGVLEEITSESDNEINTALLKSQDFWTKDTSETRPQQPKGKQKTSENELDIALSKSKDFWNANEQQDIESLVAEPAPDNTSNEINTLSSAFLKSQNFWLQN